EPFFTTKGDRGSGFGLAICKRIIEDNHLGEISVKSEYKMYTAFFIKLEKLLKENIR
ncbi:MAG: ATP-binding protein, partial [Candidatus Thorarchaeota archaeon]